MGIETYSAYRPQGNKQVKHIGKKIQDATGEKLSTFYLFQSVSIAIQIVRLKCHSRDTYEKRKWYVCDICNQRLLIKAQ